MDPLTQCKDHVLFIVNLYILRPIVLLYEVARILIVLFYETYAMLDRFGTYLILWLRVRVQPMYICVIT